MTWLDPIGAIFSLSSTFMFSHAKRCAWVFGIIAVIINTVLYLQKGIYGRLFLEFFYFISMAGGLYLWKENGSSSRNISSLNLKQCCYIICIIVPLIFILSAYLILFTDSNIPYLDAISTIGSLCAQCLLCYKIIQCWILWFFVDLLVAYLQFSKDIPFHASVHVAYIALAIYGYFKWQKLLYKQQSSFTSIAVALKS
jgi:nicotinamide mononucleotide transporter